MAQVRVTATGPQEFEVTVGDEGVATSHKVSVPDALVDELGLPGVDGEALVKESFEFLLEREPPGRTELAEWFRAQGLTPRAWGNGPGDRYGWHSHDYHKVLFCVSGSIVFHTGEGDVELHSGDRLDVEPGTDHAATVGPDGVECIEAGLPPD